MASLQTKIILVVTVVSLASAGLSLGVIGAQRAREHVLERSADSVREEARLVLWRVQDSFFQPISDVRILAHTPPMQGLLRARAAGGIDLLDGSSALQWRDRLQSIFLAMLADRPEYFQIRLIAFDDGREIVRAERRDGRLSVLTPDRLQDKSGEPYYARARTLSESEATLSGVTFNREFGRRDPRNIRAIRAMTPIYGPDGTAFGVVVINADYLQMLETTLGRIASSADVLLYNEVGDYALSRSDGGRLLIRTGHASVGDPPPELDLAGLQDVDAGFVDDGRLYGTARAPASIPGLPTLRAAAWRSADAMEQTLTRTLLEGLVIELALCIAAAAVAALAAMGLTRDLRRMTAEISRFERDPTELNLPVQARDEVGALARAFRTLLLGRAETERKARAVIDDMLDAVVVIDDRGRIEEFSRPAERLFGIPALKALGRDVSILMPPAERAGHAAAVARYDQGGPRAMVGQRSAVLAMRADGAPFHAEVSVSELRLHGRRLFSAVIRDVSDRHMRRQATEFISSVSHELRTPLTSILASLSMLDRISGATLPPKSARLLELARGGGERLARIVDDILDLEKIEAGKVELSTAVVDLRDVVRDCVERQRAAAEQRGVTLTLRAGAAACPVRVDPLRFDQALGNLMSNATRHSPKGGVVTIEARRSGLEGIRVSVTDQGPGVPEAFRDKLFVRFAQAESGKGGTGLGLNISRGLIRAFGGEVTLDPAPGPGATFHIDLPLAADPRQEVEDDVLST